ncbi:methyl-accepting chemotaxis protein [Clostridium oceanicum]|uniref:Methyl-accepting chemotaxis protein n=1 Tax=Clostridium oceanicum TaxID=1543 RepID=A0ABP3UNC2_9CLOT
MKKLNLSSIKHKIMIYFSILLVLGCVAFGITSYLISQSSLNNTVDLMLPELSKQGSKLVNQEIESKLKNLESLANIPMMKDEKIKIEEKLKLLKEEVKINGDLRMGIVDTKGNAIYTNGSKLNIKDKENIVRALRGENCIMDPSKSKIDGKIITVYTVPIKSNGKVIGAISSVLDMAAFNKFMDDISVGDTKSSFIVDKEGVTIVDKDIEVVRNQVSYIKKGEEDSNFKAVGEAVKTMIDKKEGTLEYNYDGTDKIMSFSTIKSTGWVVGVVITRHEVLSQLSKLIQGIIIAALVVIALSLIFTRFISAKIAKGIENGVKYIERASQGDFSFEINEKHLKSNDEIGKMSKSINEMKKSISDMINSIKDTSNSIENESDGLYTASNEMTNSCENVSLSIQEVAKGTQEQAEELSKITQILNEFGAKIEEAEKSVKDIETSSFDIKETADESNKHMNNLLISVRNVSHAFNQLEEKTRNVETNVDKINEITNLINSIAEQTNLLALNAAIEAARVGEAGKGFAVVADEIRKLAEQCKNSSENIATIVSTVVSDTGEMSNNTNEVKNILEKQEKSIDITAESFDKITETVDNLMPKIRTTSEAALKISEDKDDIIGRVENISAVSQEVSASSEEISASSEEMTAISNQVEDTAKKLNNMTKDMKDKVDIFNI